MVDPGRHRLPRPGQSLLILVVALAILASGAAGFYVYATGASGPRSPVTVKVPQGATATDVGELLAEAGVIRSSLVFRVAAGIQGLGSSLQAGSYRMTTNMPLSDVLTVLEAGPPPPPTTKVTFPEGLEMKDIAEVAAGELDLDRQRFLEAATSGEWSLPPYLPDGTDTVEGFLFPSTYEFPRKTVEEDVIARLLQQFGEQAAGLPWGRAKKLGLSRYEVVIVASLIEREARVPEDRAKISAVIYNRLREGMALQIDATVQYALPEDNRLLTLEDYEYPSPYNTYLHPGLPPTPIASPGLASLEAAFHPADEDYLYFVVIDESGRHGFAETYQEFLRLKEQAGL